MKADMAQLKAALQEQLDVFTELKRLLQEEQNAIVALDTTRMDQLNREKEPVVARQFRAADALRNAIASMARQTGAGTVKTVSELMHKLPQEVCAELTPMQKMVQETGGAVRELAQYNRALLEQFLATVNDSLGYLLRVLNTSNQYGASGTYIPRTQAGAVMVNKEA